MQAAALRDPVACRQSGLLHRRVALFGRVVAEEASLYCWDGDSWGELRVPGQSMPYTLGALADELVCGMADGRLLRSRDRGESCQELAVTAPIIAMVLAA